MTTKYVDGGGLAYFYTTYCLTEAQVNTLISTQLNTYKQDIVTVASSLPASGTEGILYLIPNATDGTKFDTYVWEITDNTTTPPTYGWKAQSEAHLSVDLSNYYTKSETNSEIASAITTSIASGAIKSALDAKINASDLVPLTNAEIDALMV
jgi:hypothetical protein